jgi:hypothetical protein
MRFTLSLSDYIDQYTQNKTDSDTHCPICYDQCMSMDTKIDMKHMLNCYKEELMLRTIQQYVDEFGCFPELDDGFINKVLQLVTVEMARYCESHQM